MTIPAAAKDQSKVGGPRVVLADDHVIVRQAVTSVLEHAGFQVVAEASDGKQAVKLCKELQPDVAVLDLSMPLLNGVEAASQIVRSCPNTKVTLLTVHTESHCVVAALRAGVKAYVSKADTTTELVYAIHAVRKGETYITHRASPAVLEAYRTRSKLAEPLGVRESEVVRLVAAGRNTMEIAELLGISYKTVQSHRTNIMNKLNIQDTASLVRYAISCGLAEP